MITKSYKIGDVSMEENKKIIVTVDAYGEDIGIVKLFDKDEDDEVEEFDEQREAELMISNPCEMFN